MLGWADGDIQNGTRVRDAVILIPRVEREVPGLQSWDVTRGTPFPKAPAEKSDRNTDNTNAEE